MCEFQSKNDSLSYEQLQDLPLDSIISKRVEKKPEETTNVIIKQENRKKLSKSPSSPTKRRINRIIIDSQDESEIDFFNDDNNEETEHPKIEKENYNFSPLSSPNYSENETDETNNNNNNSSSLEMDDDDVTMDENNDFDQIYSKLCSMNPSQLREECEKYSLPSGGGKSDLISRLFATKKAAVTSQQKSKSNFSNLPKPKLFPTVHFGPRVEKVISPTKENYKRIKVNETTPNDEIDKNDKQTLSQLTCREQMQLGIPMNKISFTKHKEKIKIAQALRTVEELSSNVLKTIQQRSSPLKSPPKYSNSITPSKKSNPSSSRKPQLDILTTNSKSRQTPPSSFKKISEIDLFNDDDSDSLTQELKIKYPVTDIHSLKPQEDIAGFDIISVQQRERRTESSANLPEEIVISDDEKDNDKIHQSRKPTIKKLNNSPKKEQKTPTRLHKNKPQSKISNYFNNDLKTEIQIKKDPNDVVIQTNENDSDSDDFMDDGLLDDAPKKRLTRLSKKGKENNSTFDFPKLSTIESSDSDSEMDDFTPVVPNKIKNSSLTLFLAGTKRTRSEISEEDSDLEGFIVADDEIEKPPPKKKTKLSISLEDEDDDEYAGEIIYPEDESIAIEHHFTMKQAFSVYIQYLASCQLDEHFVDQLKHHQESIGYFEPARKKIEHSIVDRRDLIVQSSAWQTQFFEDLKYFPTYDSNHTISAKTCEACCRSNHPATYVVHFNGKRYDSETLWKTKSNTIDEFDEICEPSHYDLGCFCHKRTWLYHRLHHSKFKLIQAVKRKISPMQGKLSAEEIINNILDDQQFISKQYCALQSLLQEADEFAKLGTNEHL